MKWCVLIVILQALVAAGRAASPAAEEWYPVGNVKAPEPHSNEIAFRSEHALVRLTVLAADLIRVRMTPGTAFGLDYITRTYLALLTSLLQPGKI
jgi:hypothetical protein